MPSTRHGKNSKSVAGSSSSQAQASRVPLRAGDICVGCVVWLPKQIESSQILKCVESGQDLNTGGYNHPAVVLRVRQNPVSAATGDLIISIALVTTFRDTPLLEYRTKLSSERRFCPSIPIIDRTDIAAQPPDHDKLPVLCLENEQSLFKQSYVRLDQTCNAPLSMLRSYGLTGGRAYHWRLEKTSYDQLMKLLQSDPEYYPPSDNLWETAATRLQSLANSSAVRNQVPSLHCHHSVVGAGIPESGPAATATQVVETAHLGHGVGQEPVPELPGIWPQTRYPSPYLNYDTTIELPLPTPHRTIRQQTRYPLRLIMSFLFCLVLIFAIWRIWEAIS